MFLLKIPKQATFSEVYWALSLNKKLIRHPTELSTGKFKSLNKAALNSAENNRDGIYLISATEHCLPPNQNRKTP